MLAAALGTIRAAGAEAWRPAPPVVRSQWCAENLRLPAETAAEPGSFDLDDHRYLVEILDAVDDPEVRKIVVVGATQIGKTELDRAIIASQGEVGRAPMMFAGPDRAYVVEQRDAVYARADLSPALAGRVPPKRFRNDRHIDLERCLVYLAWSGSSQRLSGRACKIVLISEADRWRRPIALAEERTKAFQDSSLVFVEGSPLGASPCLEAEYQATDRRTYRVPCPRCGQFQELRFFPFRHGPHSGRGGVAGLQDAQGQWLSPEEARQSAYYLCIKGCKIPADEQREMVRRGVWAPEGCGVNRSGKVTGKPMAEGCERRRGYRLNSLLQQPFGRVAEQYLLKRDTTEGLGGFFNDWLGLGFTPRGKTPRWRDLGERLAGTYPRGVVPRGAYFLTGAADVHLRGVWWTVRAWGGHKTSWLIDFGYLAKEAGAPGSDDDAGEVLSSDLAKLDAAVLNRHWDVLGETPHGYSRLAVRLFGIDRGYRPTDVDRFVRARKTGRLLAVYGDPHCLPGALYRLHRLERDARSGKLYPQGTDAWGIDTTAYKGEIHDRWTADRTQPGAWWLPEDIIETPGGEDYLRQVVNERRELVPLHGRKQVRFVVIATETGCHCGDTETYSAALADMVTGGQWDPAQWGLVSKAESGERKAEPAGDAVAVRELQPAEDFSAR